MSEIFSQKDTETLDRMSEIRLRAIDAMTKSGLPDDAERMSLLIHITDVETKSTLQKAKVNASNKSSDALVSIGQSMAELLRKTHNRPTVNQRIEVPKLAKDDIPHDIVPGETSLGYQQLDPDDISPD